MLERAGAATVKGSARRSKAAPEPESPEPSPKRPLLRRWGAAAAILLTAGLAVLFVANSIAVNELLSSITSVEAERDAARQENERLRAELLRLMSVERVTEQALGMGLIQPEAPPISLPMPGTNDDAEQGGR